MSRGERFGEVGKGAGRHACRKMWGGVGGNRERVGGIGRDRGRAAGQGRNDYLLLLDAHFLGEGQYKLGVCAPDRLLEVVLVQLQQKVAVAVDCGRGANLDRL